MSETKTILDMVAMNGEDGVTTRELVIASGRRVTDRTKKAMLERLAALVAEGKLAATLGWRKDIGGRPYKVPVFRPVS